MLRPCDHSFAQTYLGAAGAAAAGAAAAVGPVAAGVQPAGRGIVGGSRGAGEADQEAEAVAAPPAGAVSGCGLLGQFVNVPAVTSHVAAIGGQARLHHCWSHLQALTSQVCKFLHH